MLGSKFLCTSLSNHKNENAISRQKERNYTKQKKKKKNYQVKEKWMSSIVISVKWRNIHLNQNIMNFKRFTGTRNDEMIRKQIWKQKRASFFLTLREPCRSGCNFRYTKTNTHAKRKRGADRRIYLVTQLVEAWNLHWVRMIA